MDSIISKSFVVDLIKKTFPGAKILSIEAKYFSGYNAPAIADPAVFYIGRITSNRTGQLDVSDPLNGSAVIVCAATASVTSLSFFGSVSNVTGLSQFIGYKITTDIVP